MGTAGHFVPRLTQPSFAIAGAAKGLKLRLMRGWLFACINPHVKVKLVEVLRQREGRIHIIIIIIDLKLVAWLCHRCVVVVIIIINIIVAWLCHRIIIITIIDIKIGGGGDIVKAVAAAEVKGIHIHQLPNSNLWFHNGGARMP